MKLVSFSTTALPKPHPGILRDDEVLDVDLAGRALQLAVPDQMLDLIENYETYRPHLLALLERAGTRRFSEVQLFRDVGAVHDLTAVTLAAPIPRPRKNIMCMAVNYSEHAKETAAVRGRSATPPTVPVLFTKAPTSVNHPGGPIVIDPEVSEQIDWEIELGVIIGKTGKNIREDEALSYVFGYTILNDVTARDLQSYHKQYFKGKSLDGSCPMGPAIVTADELTDPQHLRLQLRVNGVTKQDGNTDQMIFSIPQIIATLSRGMTLEAGDIIATGTPHGVGFSRTPPEFLKPGDIMEAEIEQIGILINPVLSS